MGNTRVSDIESSSVILDQTRNHRKLTSEAKLTQKYDEAERGGMKCNNTNQKKRDLEITTFICP